MFEHALELLHELVGQYLTNAFSYKKVSAAHRIMAHAYDQIVSVSRYHPAYFRVVFLGAGWQSTSTVVNVRGKQFIYAARPFEKLGEFIEKMLSVYPDAQLTSNNTWPPNKSMVDSE